MDRFQRLEPSVSSGDDVIGIGSPDDFRKGQLSAGGHAYDKLAINLSAVGLAAIVAFWV